MVNVKETKINRSSAVQISFSLKLLLDKTIQNFTNLKQGQNRHWVSVMVHKPKRLGNHGLIFSNTLFYISQF